MMLFSPAQYAFFSTSLLMACIPQIHTVVAPQARLLHATSHPFCSVAVDALFGPLNSLYYIFFIHAVRVDTHLLCHFSYVIEIHHIPPFSKNLLGIHKNQPINRRVFRKQTLGDNGPDSIMNNDSIWSRK